MKILYYKGKKSIRDRLILIASRNPKKHANDITTNVVIRKSLKDQSVLAFFISQTLLMCQP